MSSHFLLTAGLALALAAVHAGAGYVRFSAVVPRDGWLSFGGGVSVAYVFVHVLPELGAGQVIIAEAEHTLVDYLAHHAYLMALVGFTLFHGLERWAVRVRGFDGEVDDDGEPAPDESSGIREGEVSEWGTPVFWAHMLSYGLLNALVGYLLAGRATGGDNAVLFAVAMGFHFVVNDDSLRRHHSDAYDRLGRWILAAAVVGGWMLSMVVHVHHAVVMGAFAFVSGGVILNVIKEELPSERESQFGYFLVGATAYAALLVWG
ncbi:hypothetical protein [Halostella pelagica]|uniref:hypothetical protein n=1 Tax=Halostella pelagica TaxID=2583824 RepID=UPI00108095BF|nr:hypothetical protein [Halostella pelagica]